MANILVIDDDLSMCRVLCGMAGQMGEPSTYVQTLTEGVSMAVSGVFDVVFLDVRMPDGNGLEALPKILAAPESPEVIIITGKGDPIGAELAIKGGAWDYIQKPVLMEEIQITLLRALQYRQAKRNRKPAIALKRAGIIGSGPLTAHCLDLVAEAANSDANVLIRGETGTGKELFAKAIHENSPRAGHNFVVVDCAALPENLVESILFGHEKGSFTGADRVRQGLVAQADGGTLFLDEVGELPPTVQKSFLRVLQERRFRPLGAQRELKSDFRLISATHRNLDQMVLSSQFRSDLLFRLRTIAIDLPPLRDRAGDIYELVTWGVNKVCERYGTGIKGFSPEFIDVLCKYGWPGNVRELLNAIERAIGAARDAAILFPKHLPTEIRVEIVTASLQTLPCDERANGELPSPPSTRFPSFRVFRQAGLDALERKYLLDLLVEAGGRLKEAARIAELSRTRLYTLLKKHNLSGPDD
jgi:two-component system NtrC family response regulator